MANEEHLELLRRGVHAWNAWREEEPAIEPDLAEAQLSGIDLDDANLSGSNLISADLRGAYLRHANLDDALLWKADLNGADISGAELNGSTLVAANFSFANLSSSRFINANIAGANLIGTNLSKADLSDTDLSMANLSGANLREADLWRANLWRAVLTKADLRNATLTRAVLSETDFAGADLSGANLFKTDLYRANLSGANLSGTRLDRATLVEVDLTSANLTGCHVYGVSVWQPKLSKDTQQQNLVITPADEAEVTVDNIEVAQFVYLLLHNEKIRDVVDTIGKKGVLLLGRFTEGRIEVLERLRGELRRRDFLPIVFNFDKPETKNFTETVRLLASLSRFVIVDITNPRSAPLELQATVPECMVPFIPILDKNEKLEPFAMLRDLQIAHPDRVSHVIRYPSVDRLIAVLDDEIIKPAQVKFDELLARKAESVRIKDI